MKVSKLLAPVAFAAATLFSASAANAALLVDVTTASANGGMPILISDNLSGDLDLDVGSIKFDSAVGDWELALAVGSGIINPFELHLSTIVQGRGREGPITIRLTQTGMVAGSPGLDFNSFGGGATTSGATVTWSTFVDDTNAAFGLATQISGSSASGPVAFADLLSVPLTGTYSATMVVTYDYTGVVAGVSKKTSSLDVHMNVPEPTSIALVGLALLGAGFASRRKA